MKKQILLILSVLCTFSLLASPGDTTVVYAHQKTDMVWYNSYRAWAPFPDSTHSYHQIKMELTLGCATGGCSDWDYTTLINIRNRTGRLDSAVSRIDTLQTNPLVVDTVWRVFDEIEPYELCKIITPYGGSLSQSWTRTFTYDVTEYYPLLRDSVELEAFYQGWSSGFSVSIKFTMIEGTPPRDVLSVGNLYRKKFNYINSAQVEREHLPARSVSLHPGATQFEARVAPSGHGFVNSLNCAEFCNKDYYLSVNGNRVATQAMWRNDCGLNSVWPQAGTWLFDRANWCPGDKVNIYTHNLTPHLSGSSATINLDIEPYSYTVPAGEVPANYNMSAQLLQMGDFNYQLDAEIKAIISPSLNDAYGRENPVCNEAQILVRNLGANPITTLDLQYGVAGNTNWQQHQWTGNLEPLAETTLTLPMGDISNWTSWQDTLRFMAQILKVNGQTDELAYNNRRESGFVPTPQFPGMISFNLRTNAAAAETSWQLKDLVADTIIEQGDNLSNNTVYRDSLNLPSGCYQLTIFDSDKDGLSFFANNDGSGSANLRNVGGSFFYYTVNPNFGTRFQLNFTVGYGIGLPDEAALGSPVAVFPNPAQGQLHLQWEGATAVNCSYRLLSINGQLLQESPVQNTSSLDETLDISQLSPGLYLLEVNLGEVTWQEKVVVK